METLWHDIRGGLRILVRSPGFAAVTVLTLAIGIAANTAVFSLVNAFLWRPLPFDQPEKLVHIWATDPQRGYDQLRVSVPNFLDWEEQNTVFADLGGYFYRSYNLANDEEPIALLVGRLTPNMIELLGVEPILGRGFLPEEGQPGKDRVVILGDSFWRRYFAGSPNVLGETVTLDDETYTVIGVMPPEFVFPLKAAQMWSPLPLDEWTSRREMGGPLLVVGRLAAGATMEEAAAEMDTIAGRLEQAYPQDNLGNGAQVVPLREALVFFYDLLRLTFATLFLAVGFVLLIVCANVGNLLLARATGRHREIAIRTALGGGRGRLIRQLLTESALLALLGAAVGGVLAYWLVGILGPTIPEDLYRVGTIRVDGSALGFTLGVSLLAALVFGLAPALQTTKPNLAEALKDAERGSSGGVGSRRLRSALVVAEVALAMVLLAGSALMVQSFYRLQNVETGFNPDNLLTMEVILPESKYPGDREQNIFYQDVVGRIRTLPGVESAATVYPLPLNFESLSRGFAIEGRPPAEPGEKLFANIFWIGTDYLKTMEIPLLRGRSFTEQDNEQAAPVVIVNRRMVERFWPDSDPLGQRLRLQPDTEEERLATVVGVVGNSKHFLLNEDTASLLYLPQLQDSRRRRFFMTRTTGDPLSLVASVREEIHAADNDLPVTTIRSMNRVVQESLGPWSGGTAGIGVLGFGALLLAAMGIYGVISYSVGQRLHEMGIRIALGAGGGDIQKLVLKQGLRLTVAGIIIGLAAAVGLAQLMQALLFGVGTLDPLTFIGTPILLIAVALLASYLPARRATRVDPMTALRYE
jgi:putative ABC transport system permease protein